MFNKFTNYKLSVNLYCNCEFIVDKKKLKLKINNIIINSNNNNIINVKLSSCRCFLLLISYIHANYSPRTKHEYARIARQRWTNHDNT